MNEKQTVRPTKKQREVLDFISTFTAGHGYSPSYREIMASLGYTSLATVALHVRSLITRGQLRKRGASARSLEVVSQPTLPNTAESGEVWLDRRIKRWLKQAEKSQLNTKNDLVTIQAALKILNLSTMAETLAPPSKQVSKNSPN